MQKIDPNPIDNPQFIDADLIKKVISRFSKVIVQFSYSCYNDKILSQIDQLCQEYGPEFRVRFYGHYTEVFDFKVLLKIPNVKSLSINCLIAAKNISILSELKNIKELFIGIYEMPDLEILNYNNLKNLSCLCLHETKSKALNLEYLNEYIKLRTLYIGGHTKNINAVGELKDLEFLSLNSVKRAPVSFVNNLKNLKILKFILGGRSNILEIEENEIETLEIVWVRGFNDLSNISNFKKLKHLVIENNKQILKLEFNAELPALENLKIGNCKNLNSLTGLERLISLKNLTIYQTCLDFENIFNQNLATTLDYFCFSTRKLRIDKEIKRRIIEKGYKTW